MKFKKSKAHNRRNRSLAIVGLAASLLTPGVAHAAPQNGVVSSGQATISTPNSTTTQIKQTSPTAIINWNSFGVNANELVQFIQPSALAVALNRVTGVAPSVILGSLQANGRVFLLNSNGILFGPNSQVDVGGLLATTLTMSDSDFLAGNYNLVQGSGSLASVVNQGKISAANGGYIVLVAPLVSNEGVLVANLGKVTMFAGQQASISFDGGLLSYAANPNAPGDVVMSQQALSGVLQSVVNNTNVVTAGGVVQQGDGSYVLTGSEGLVVNAGKISVDGNAKSNAGIVNVTGTQSADITGSISANSGGWRSSGGNVTVYSQDFTLFDTSGVITAKGGAIDLSSANTVDLFGTASANRITDPSNVTTVTFTFLTTGSGDFIDVTDHIIIQDNNAGNGIRPSGNVSLTATGASTNKGITFTSPSGSTTPTLGTSGSSNLTIQTSGGTGNVNLTNSTATLNLSSGAGAITVDSAGGSVTTGNAVSTAGGAISITAHGAAASTSSVGRVTGGAVSLDTEGGTFSTTGPVVASTSVNLINGGTKTLTTSGITVNNSTTPITLTNNGTGVINTGNVIGSTTITIATAGSSAVLDTVGTLSNSVSGSLTADLTTGTPDLKVGNIIVNPGALTVNATLGSGALTLGTLKSSGNLGVVATDASQLGSLTVGDVSTTGAASTIQLTGSTGPSNLGANIQATTLTTAAGSITANSAGALTVTGATQTTGADVNLTGATVSTGSITGANVFVTSNDATGTTSSVGAIVATGNVSLSSGSTLNATTVATGTNDQLNLAALSATGNITVTSLNENGGNLTVVASGTLGATETINAVTLPAAGDIIMNLASAPSLTINANTNTTGNVSITTTGGTGQIQFGNIASKDVTVNNNGTGTLVLGTIGTTDTSGVLTLNTSSSGAVQTGAYTTTNVIPTIQDLGTTTTGGGVTVGALTAGAGSTQIALVNDSTGANATLTTGNFNFTGNTVNVTGSGPGNMTVGNLVRSGGAGNETVNLTATSASSSLTTGTINTINGNLTVNGSGAGSTAVGQVTGPNTGNMLVTLNSTTNSSVGTGTVVDTFAGGNITIDSTHNSGNMTGSATANAGNITVTAVGNITSNGSWNANNGVVPGDGNSTIAGNLSITSTAGQIDNAGGQQIADNVTETAAGNIPDDHGSTDIIAVNLTLKSGGPAGIGGVGSVGINGMELVIYGNLTATMTSPGATAIFDLNTAANDIAQPTIPANLSVTMNDGTLILNDNETTNNGNQFGNVTTSGATTTVGILQTDSATTHVMGNYNLSLTNTGVNGFTVQALQMGSGAGSNNVTLNTVGGANVTSGGPVILGVGNSTGITTPGNVVIDAFGSISHAGNATVTDIVGTAGSTGNVTLLSTNGSIGATGAVVSANTTHTLTASTGTDLSGNSTAPGSTITLTDVSQPGTLNVTLFSDGGSGNGNTSTVKLGASDSIAYTDAGKLTASVAGTTAVNFTDHSTSGITVGVANFTTNTLTLTADGNTTGAGIGGAQFESPNNILTAGTATLKSTNGDIGSNANVQFGQDADIDVSLNGGNGTLNASAAGNISINSKGTTGTALQVGNIAAGSGASSAGGNAEIITMSTFTTPSSLAGGGVNLTGTVTGTNSTATGSFTVFADSITESAGSITAGNVLLFGSRGDVGTAAKAIQTNTTSLTTDSVATGGKVFVHNNTTLNNLAVATFNGNVTITQGAGNTNVLSLVNGSKLAGQTEVTSAVALSGTLTIESDGTNNFSIDSTLTAHNVNLHMYGAEDTTNAGGQLINGLGAGGVDVSATGGTVNIQTVTNTKGNSSVRADVGSAGNSFNIHLNGGSFTEQTFNLLFATIPNSSLNSIVITP